MLPGLSGCRKAGRSARRSSQLRARVSQLLQRHRPQTWERRALPPCRGALPSRGPGPQGGGGRGFLRPGRWGRGRPGGSGGVRTGHGKQGHGAPGVGEGRPGRALGPPTLLPWIPDLPRGEAGGTGGVPAGDEPALQGEARPLARRRRRFRTWAGGAGRSQQRAAPSPAPRAASWLCSLSGPSLLGQVAARRVLEAGDPGSVVVQKSSCLLTATWAFRRGAACVRAWRLDRTPVGGRGATGSSHPEARGGFGPAEIPFPKKGLERKQ